MLELGNIAFRFAWVLLFIPLLWWMFIILRRQRRTSGVFLPTAAAVKDFVTLRTKLFRYLPWIKFAGLSFILISLAGPQRLEKNETINDSGIDISLVIDLSSSMLARDFKPNRLEVTKTLAEQFVKERPNDRISVSVFAGEALAQCPLTYDHRMVVNILRNLNAGALDDGTAIGMGLVSAVNTLKDSKAKSKVVILLTDGVNTAGYIDPLTAAKLAADYHLRVYVIGVGSEGEAETPISRTPSGQVIYGYVPVEIDEPLMTEIANLTNGQYFRAKDENSLQQIYNRINLLEKTKIEKTVLKKRYDEYAWFLLIGIGLILTETILKNTWLRTPLFIKY
ncbi:MAG: VWA domain-containing protein [Saprospiraceae bacterium]|nr:MAG: von Willebrand factor A [Candidatus Parvibacillus calidus]MCC7148824.1 VWA domain-containing protein [Saprospiraceae bacterium]WKZ61895.1 MAG: VWA domain-containing protein [Saprospiraceae bacterium]